MWILGLKGLMLCNTKEKNKQLHVSKQTNEKVHTMHLV